MPQEPRQTLLLIATIVRNSWHTLPFAHRDAIDSYGNLATLCADRGIALHLAHYENLRGNGEALTWAWEDGAWRPTILPLREVSLCYADLPQNFPQAGAFRQALEPHPITVVNALRLSDLLTDKLATHREFEDQIPLTWSADTPHLVERLKAVQLHSDLSMDRLVLKPRFGERGRGIHVTNLDDLPTHPALKLPGYILQPFLETDSGIPELGIHGRHDLRLILRNGEIVLAFARLPAEASYVSNCSQGGREVPLAVADLPGRIVGFAADIDTRLSAFGPRLYSLDLGVGRSGKLWIYELNTMPGIVWDRKTPENHVLHERMHRIVADWLDSSSRSDAWSTTVALPSKRHVPEDVRITSSRVGREGYAVSPGPAVVSR